MSDVAGLIAELIERTRSARARVKTDPFTNPVLAVVLTVAKHMDDGTLDSTRIAALVRTLRDDAYQARAARLATYVGGVDPHATATALDTLSKRVASGSLDAFKADIERTRFMAVFTAHPTFSLPRAIAHDLAEMASGGAPPPSAESHRPTKPTLAEEFDQAVAAIETGRDAIDHFTRALLAAARDHWPEAWTGLAPRPIALASWVGYDTDGRTDIAWWDTIRFRLRMKAMQLERFRAQIADVPGTDALAGTLATAVDAVDAQIAACPTGARAEPAAVAAFARTLIERRDDALVSNAPLLALFDAAIAGADPADAMALCVARAGLLSHGLGLAHTQFRLNSTQLHNTLRQQVHIDDQVGDASRRRAMLAAINTALDEITPTAVDFGALLAETSSATRLMMTMAQILKHVDGDSRIRFHIAETENGFTLLCALWLARLFGIEDRVEISPLFETAEALEHGARVLDEALRSRHWRAYLQKIGVLAIEFGYSDSGRYVGQLAASYMIERQRLKIAAVLERHGITNVEIVIFDTHGESIGRGAHPGSLQDRLKFLNPTRTRKDLTRAGFRVREESAFQGGDGYLFFGTPALALATVARIAEHVFDDDARPDARRLPPDPVYEDSDFAADFFGAMRARMEALVEDPGYAALLGTFGPALIDPTGSRPSARQIDGMGGPARISHPRELRAIPNNAILQQLGWCANTLQGLGAALSRHPQAFSELLGRSPRFRRAIDFAAHGLRHSDFDVLHAVIVTLDPGSWLTRAEHAGDDEQRGGFVQLSVALETIGIAAPCYTTLRRIQVDHLLLRSVWRDAPSMAAPEVVLHAVRLALIQRLWMLATKIPEFSPRHGVTRQTLIMRLLQLDVPATLETLAAIFPEQPDAAADQDYFEPRGLRPAGDYAREHREIFEPIAGLFAMVREIGTAITHSVGAFG